MLKVTNKAIAVLEQAKARLGAPSEAGIRIVHGMAPDDSARPEVTIGFAISAEPAADDEEFEQDGLRIFVEDTLTEVLDDRTLDAREAREGPELFLR